MSSDGNHPPGASHARPRGEVANQSPPLEGWNVFASDRVLVEALRREGGGWAEERARAFGEAAGRRETIALGVAANENRPVLRTHDRSGRRLDVVEFHPAWHALLGLGVESGLHALPWRQPRPGAQVARAALFITLAEIEAGVGCPLSMTFSAVPALRTELAGAWAERVGPEGRGVQTILEMVNHTRLDCGLAWTCCARCRSRRRRSTHFSKSSAERAAPTAASTSI